MTEHLALSGSVSVLTIWFAIGYVLLRQRNSLKLSESISHHAARSSTDHKVYAIVMSFGLVTVWLFIFVGLANAYGLPALFTIVVSTAIVLELFATWVPLTEGRSYIAHQLSSYLVAALLPAMLLMILIWSELLYFARIVALSSMLLMFLIGLIFAFIPSARRYYLIYQALYIFLFHVSLIILVFNYS
jgi:hypothetical protein